MPLSLRDAVALSLDLIAKGLDREKILALLGSEPAAVVKPRAAPKRHLKLIEKPVGKISTLIMEALAGSAPIPLRNLAQKIPGFSRASVNQSATRMARAGILAREDGLYSLKVRGRGPRMRELAKPAVPFEVKASPVLERS